MISLTLSKVSLLPDATADNLPAFTHFPFPETGQARNSEPLSVTVCRNSADSGALIEEHSTKIFGVPSPDITPTSPK